MKWSLPSCCPVSTHHSFPRCSYPFPHLQWLPKARPLSLGIPAASGTVLGISEEHPPCLDPIPMAWTSSVLAHFLQVGLLTFGDPRGHSPEKGTPVHRTKFCNHFRRLMDQREPICKSLSVRVWRAKTVLQGGITLWPQHNFPASVSSSVEWESPQRVCVSLKVHVCKPHSCVPHRSHVSVLTGHTNPPYTDTVASLNGPGSFQPGNLGCSILSA